MAKKIINGNLQINEALQTNSITNIDNNDMVISLGGENINIPYVNAGGYINCAEMEYDSTQTYYFNNDELGLEPAGGWTEITDEVATEMIGGSLEENWDWVAEYAYIFQAGNTYNITFPTKNGTVALTSDLDSKQDTLVGSGTGQNIKTINSTSLLGSGDIAVQPTITGGATTITDTDLTPDKVLVSNSSGKVVTSDVPSSFIANEYDKTLNRLNINNPVSMYAINYSITGDDLTISVSNSSWANIEYIIEPNKQYTLTFTANNSGKVVWATSETDLYNVDFSSGSFSVTFTSTKNYLRFYASWGSNLTKTIKLSNIMLNEGSTALPYTAYGGGAIMHKGNIDIINMVDKTFNASTTLGYTGYSITIPANCVYNLTLKCAYVNDRPLTVAWCYSNYYNYQETAASGGDYAFGLSTTATGYTGNSSKTLYAYARYGNSTVNALDIKGYYIKLD